MTIKVKHILSVILIVIVAIILYKFLNKPIKEYIDQKVIGEKLINFYNLENFNDVSKGTLEEYEYYKNYYNEPDIDISPLIESYIKQVESNEEHSYNGEFRVKRTSNLRREILCDDYTYTAKLYHGINRISSISELEKILIHKGNDKYSDWCIPKDSPSIIDLPYNFYLKYEPSDFKLIDKVKKVTKCTFIDPVTEYTYNGRKRIKLEYLDKNHNNKTINGVIFLSNDENDKLGAFLIGLYYTETHNAKIELKNHDYDEWLKEKEKEEETAPWNQDQGYLNSDHIWK